MYDTEALQRSIRSTIIYWCVSKTHFRCSFVVRTSNVWRVNFLITCTQYYSVLFIFAVRVYLIFFAFSSCIHWFYIWPIIVRVQREYYLVVVRIQLMKILNKWKKYLTRNNTKAGRSTNGNAIHTPAQLSFRTMYYTKVRCDDWYCGFCFFFSSTIIRVLMVEVLIVPPSSTLPLKKYNKFISFPSVCMVKRCDDEEFTPPVAIPTIIHSFIHQFYDYVKSMTCSHVNRVFPS